MMLTSMTHISNAQVSSYYIFTQSNGVYTPGTSGFIDTTGLPTNTPATIFSSSWDDDYAKFRLPFNFTYNGILYPANTSWIGLDSDAWFAFSLTNPTMTGQLGGGSWVSVSDHTGVYLKGNANNNGFAGFNADLNYQSFATFTANATSGSNQLSGASSIANIQIGTRLSGTGIPDGTIVTAIAGTTITMSSNATATTNNVTITPYTSIVVFLRGTAPNRQFVVQWTQTKRYGGTASDNFNFQMILNEAGGVANLQTLQVVYGSNATTQADNLNTQVGLRGADSLDFNARKSSTGWAISTAATTNADVVSANPTTVPASGLTFTWSPCTVAPGAAAAIVGNSPVCPNTTQTYTIPAVSGAVNYVWNYSGTGATFTATTNVPSVTITFASNATSGNLTVTPSNICGTGAQAIKNIVITAVSNATVSYSAASYCASTSGAFSPVITGVAGGTFAATPAGLSISNAGIITPSTSTPGTYTINYNYNSNGCPLLATTTVSIVPNPRLTVTATPNVVCSGGNSQLSAVANDTSNYSVISIPHTMLTPTGTATNVWNAYVDDANSGVIAMPFAFTYFGAAITQFSISTNGWIELQNNSGLTALTPQTLPSATTPNNVIAMCWNDLVLDPATHTSPYIRYFVNGTAPNRILVVEYYNLRFIGGTSAQNVTGQIRLYEGDRHIEVALVSVNDNGGARSKTLGIENGGGTLGVTPNGRNNAVWNVANEAWAFYPPVGAYTYAWTPSTFLNNAAIYNPLATAINANVTYTVRVTNTVTGCFTDSTVSIQATSPGVAGVIAGPTPVCPNTTQTYSVPAVAGATSYTWSYSGTGASFTSSTLLPTVSIIFASNATGGNLSVTPVNNCGNGVPSVKSIAVSAVTLATLTYPAGICVGSATVNPTITGPTGGVFTISPAAGLTINSTTGVLTPAAATAGTYTITYTYSSNGCSLSATAPVTISANSISATATATPSSVCAGGTSQLQVNVTNTSNYSVNSIAYTALNPSTTATTLWNVYTDDAFSAAITMPFTFNFYGNAITQFYVHTNGRIELQTSSGLTGTTPQTLPNVATPNNLIAMCWDDLVLDPATNAGANVRYFVNGTTPNRIMVIEYTNLRFLAGTGAQNITGQIRLYETDSHIEVALATVNDNASNRSKTLGIENSNGTLATTPAGRNNAVWNVTNEAWAFYPPVNNYTYAWTPTASVSNATISNPVTTAIAATTTYNVTVSSPSSGCAFNTTVTVNVAAGMSGTYTVGAGGNYTTLTAAVNDYNTRCITGPVVFSLISNTYSAGETFPIVINRNVYQSAVNTLTIKPASGITATISGSVASAPVFRVLGNYITIDGSNNGTTSRNLIITNTNATAARVLLIGSTGTTPVTNTTIKNTVLTNTGTNAATLLLSDATTLGNPGYFRDITIQNDSINLGFHGIYCIGINAAGNGKGLSITDNNLTASGTSAIGDYGIYLQDVDSASVLRNQIGNLLGSNNNNDKGIWLATGVRNTTVAFNKVFNLNYTGTNGNGPHGIYISSGRAAANITLSNNMISNITGDGSSVTNVTNTLANPTGILLTTNQSGINIFHNTINLYGNTLNKANAVSVCVRLDTNSVADIRNNIFVNSLGRLTAGTVTGIAAYGVFAATLATQFTNLNYNNYFINAATAGATNYDGRVGATSSALIAAWRTTSGREANGTEVKPIFLADSVHINALNAGNAAISNTAAAIAGINNDYDGQTRNGATPDMGADEWIEPNKGSWVGRVSIDWLNPLNWESNVVPDGTTDVFITGGYTFMPTIVTTQQVRDINLSAPVPANTPTLTLAGGTIQINRNLSRTGGANVDGLDGTVILASTGSQTIPANFFKNNNLKNLVIANTHAATGVGIGGYLNIYRSITFSQPANVPQRLNMGTIIGYVTFKSTATETAWLGKTTGKTIVGTATVERYIPTGINHGKSWQLLSIPTKGTQTIKQAWQDSATAPNQNRYSGFGTQITSNLGGNTAGAVALGFDAYSAAGPSMKIYNPATNLYDGVASTTIPIQNKKGYMVFVRGSRADTAFNQPSTATTLRTKGTLFTTGVDAPPIDTVPANQFQTIGNPYVSAIDFTNLIYDGPPNIKNAFYLWDPKLGGIYGYGGFQTFSGAIDFVPTPGGTAYYPTGVRNTKIQSGQAFMMQGDVLGGTVTFTEDVKIDSSRLMFRPEPVAQTWNQDKQILFANLYNINSGDPVLVDGNALAIKSSFSNDLTADDAEKMMNANENFAINNSKLLAVEARQSINTNDTVHYYLNHLRVANYRMVFQPMNMDGSNLTPYLVDRYTSSITPLSVSGNSSYDFNVINAAGSYASDRFYIIFRPTAPLPVRMTSIQAKRISDHAAIINWNVNNEIQLNHYELEKSDDGLQFEKIADILPLNNNGGAARYQYSDDQAGVSQVFYRVKAIDMDRSFAYSQIVKINPVKFEPSIRIIPNPVTDGILRLEFDNMPAGKYQGQIYNTAGQLMQQFDLNHSATEKVHKLQINRSYSSGNYKVKLIDAQGISFIQEMLVK